MTRAVLLIAVSLALTDCRNERLSPLQGGLIARPQALHFADAAPGTSETAAFSIENAAGHLIIAHLSVAPPFTVDEPDVALTAGEKLTVNVRFSPEGGGDFSGQLTVTWDTGTLSVALSARASCVATGPCRSAQLDANGHCGETNVADGTSCQDPCLLDGATCEAGRCVGSFKSCDDQNPCTTDACGPSGCVHLSCSPPADPCQAALCDPKVGCVATQVQDGVACGPSDCTRSRVCINGQCTVAATPDGASCGAFCGNGVCVDGTCTSSVVPYAWAYLVPSGWSVVSRIALDGSENVYFVETAASFSGPLYLTSLTRDGSPRFRAIPSGNSAAFSRPVLLLDGQAQAAMTGIVANEWTAFKMSDGAQLWQRSLIGDYLDPSSLPAGETAFVSEAVKAADGVTVLAMFLYPPAGSGLVAPNGGALVGINPTTGARLWEVHLQRLPVGLIGDPNGGVFVKTSETVSGTVASYSQTGAVRWTNANISGSDTTPVAAFAGKLFLAHGEALDAATGQVVSAPPLLPTDSTLLGDPTYLQGSWLLSGSTEIFEIGQYGKLRAVDPATQVIRWTNTMGTYQFSSSPAGVSALLHDASVVMLDESDQQERLIHVGGDGQLADTCTLAAPSNGSHAVAVAFGAGRVYVAWDAPGGGSSSVALQAFDVPGAKPAATGWVVGGGEEALDGRPR